MWKLLALASVALAQDVGEPVTFPRLQSLSFTSPFNTGESLDVSVPWDTVILHGVSGDPAVQIDARRRINGVWTQWTTGPVKLFPGGRFWGRVRFRGITAPGTVQVHVTATGRSEIYSVETFNSAEVERPGPAALQEEPAPRPPVHGRQEWGALPPKADYSTHTAVKLTLHHTAGRNTATLEESLNEVRFIQDFHQNGRGWIDIGYHYLVDSRGNVFAGRPEEAVGAHVKNANTGNLGISMMGYHHAPKDEPVSAATLAALDKLLRGLSLDHQIPAAELRGHRDFSQPTSCPGDLGHAELPGLRQRLSQPPPSVINPAAKITRYTP
jgi:hypothetical protein